MRLLAGIVFLCFLASDALAKPAISAVRVGIHPGKTRFVLEMSEPPAYRIFLLPDPYRVVIDLPEVDWTLERPTRRWARGFIAALRFGLYAPGTSRVVLDLSSAVEIQAAFVLPPRDGRQYRMVIDLGRANRNTFLAAVRAGPILSKRPLPRVQPSAPVPSHDLADTRPTIIIDPGHGGVDPGTVGRAGSHEKEVTLAVAKALKAELESLGHYKVIMTRRKDIFVRLSRRVELARRADGDLFVSLHADAHRSSKLRGASVYTLSEKASDKAAAALAAKENKSDVIAGVNLSDQTPVVSKILIDLAQRETKNLSAQFASMLIKDLAKETRVLRNSHRFAGFAVLKAPDIPSVLVELGYLSNPVEEKLLTTRPHQRRIAKTITNAIDRYFALQRNLNRS